MRTVAEYRHNAEQCRNLAKLLTKPDDKKSLEHMGQSWEKLAEQLGHMAQTWEKLAEQREHELDRPEHF